jgi:transcriptional regulator with XRE-family HTH domain
MQMPKTQRPAKTKSYRRTYLRDWRKHRGMTLQGVADRLTDEYGEPFTHASLSRVERRLQPYNQGLLEALADIYQTDVVSLLARRPGDPEGIWQVWEDAKPNARKQIVEVAKTLVRTTE